MPAQDLLIPTIHPPHEFSQSPLLGNAPRKRDILLFLRGDVGQHRCRLPRPQQTLKLLRGPSFPSKTERQL